MPWRSAISFANEISWESRRVSETVDASAACWLRMAGRRLDGAIASRSSRAAQSLRVTCGDRAPSNRLPAIRNQQAALASTVSDTLRDLPRISFALIADRQGIGVDASAACWLRMAGRRSCSGAGAPHLAGASVDLLRRLERRRAPFLTAIAGSARPLRGPARCAPAPNGRRPG